MNINKMFDRAKFAIGNRTYLNHYTCLDSLEYILKFKSLRLSRIDTVNDLIEHKRMDVFEDKKGFIACFTKRQRESFFFWKVYSHKQEGSIGVRISFPADVAFLDELYFDLECTKQIPLISRTDFSFCQYCEESDWGIRHIKPYNVIYVDDINSLKYEDEFLRDFHMNCVTSCGLSPIIHHFPCIVKTKEWDSEEEVRIVVFARPKGSETKCAKTVFGKDEYPQPPFSHIYLKLTDNLLERCIITLSPFNSKDFDTFSETLKKYDFISPAQITNSVMAINNR